MVHQGRCSISSADMGENSLGRPRYDPLQRLCFLPRLQPIFADHHGLVVKAAVLAHVILKERAALLFLSTLSVFPSGLRRIGHGFGQTHFIIVIDLVAAQARAKGAHYSASVGRSVASLRFQSVVALFVVGRLFVVRSVTCRPVRCLSSSPPFAVGSADVVCVFFNELEMKCRRYSKFKSSGMNHKAEATRLRWAQLS